MRLLLALLFLASTAQAETFTRNAPPFGPRQVQSAMEVVTNTDPTSAGFEWAIHSVLNNYVNTDAENVAIYGQAFKHGHGTTWAGVFETQDFEGSNGAWGVEVDLAGNGNVRPDTLRVGVGVLLWRDSAHRFGSNRYGANYGVWVAATPDELPWVSWDYGLRVETHCTKACVSVKSGEKVCFDDNAEICMEFDAKTGYLSFTNRGRAVFQFQMDTAALNRNPG